MKTEVCKKKMLRSMIPLRGQLMITLCQPLVMRCLHWKLLLVSKRVTSGIAGAVNFARVERPAGVRLGLRCVFSVCVGDRQGGENEETRAAGAGMGCGGDGVWGGGGRSEGAGCCSFVLARGSSMAGLGVADLWFRSRQPPMKILPTAMLLALVLTTGASAMVTLDQSTAQCSSVYVFKAITWTKACNFVGISFVGSCFPGIVYWR